MPGDPQQNPVEPAQPTVLLGVWQSVKRFLVRHLGLLVVLALLLLAAWVDSNWFCHRGIHWSWHVVMAAWLFTASYHDWLGMYFVLFLLTFFLAFSDLYLKIGQRSEKLQRRLSLGACKNLSFLIYLGVYFFLAALAFHYFYDKNKDHWLLAAAGAALAGITAANADIKFGGFSLQPLAGFLVALETVVEASISTQLTESHIARGAALRDQLILLFDVPRLEREFILIGKTQADLNAELALAGGSKNDTYKGLLANIIIADSEANARRLIDESSGDFFRFRSWF